MKKYLRLEDIGAYIKSFKVSNDIWEIVLRWDYFAKQTVGKQFVEAVDSISANIAEGFGRYYKKDKINFYRYSYGSLNESIDWMEKAYKRRLIKMEVYDELSRNLKELFREVRSLINYTDQKLSF